MLNCYALKRSMKKSKIVNSFSQFDPEIEAKVDAMMSLDAPNPSKPDNIELEKEEKPTTSVFLDSHDSKPLSDNHLDEAINSSLKDNSLKDNLESDAEKPKENILIIEDNAFNQTVPVEVNQQSNLHSMTNSSQLNDELLVDDNVIEEIERTEADDLLALEDRLEDELNQNATKKSYHKLVIMITSLIIIVLIIVYWLYVRGKKW